MDRAAWAAVSRLSSWRGRDRYPLCSRTGCVPGRLARWPLALAESVRGIPGEAHARCSAVSRMIGFLHAEALVPSHGAVAPLAHLPRDGARVLPLRRRHRQSLHVVQGQRGAHRQPRLAGADGRRRPAVRRTRGDRLPQHGRVHRLQGLRVAARAGSLGSRNDALGRSFTHLCHGQPWRAAGGPGIQ